MNDIENSIQQGTALAEKPIAWMPYVEKEAYDKLMAHMTKEEKKQHAYFFWNNFSMDGYEEFVQELETFNNDKQTDSITDKEPE